MSIDQQYVFKNSITMFSELMEALGHGGHSSVPGGTSQVNQDCSPVTSEGFIMKPYTEFRHEE